MDLEIDVRTAFFAVLLAVVTLLTYQIVLPFLTYILAAVLLAFLLFPLHRRVSSRLGDRPSALLLVTGAVGVAGATVALLVATVPADASGLASTVQDLLSKGRVERRLERLLGVDVPLGSILADVPRRIAQVLIGDLSKIAGALVDAFLGIVLLVFLLYYLLKDGDRLVSWMMRMAPLRPEVAEELRTEAYTTTWAVLKGHVFVAFVQGIVAGIGLFAVGIPNVAFWTVVMMFLELLPVIGVAGVLGPAIVYLVLVNRFLAAGFLLVYGLTIVAAVDDYLRALVIDRHSSLHSGAILVGVFGGVYAFGVMGLFYGPIIVGLFQTFVRLFDEHYVGDAGEGGSYDRDAESGTYDEGTESGNHDGSIESGTCDDTESGTNVSTESGTRDRNAEDGDGDDGDGEGGDDHGGDREGGNSAGDDGE